MARPRAGARPSSRSFSARQVGVEADRAQARIVLAGFGMTTERAGTPQPLISSAVARIPRNCSPPFKLALRIDPIPNKTTKRALLTTACLPTL